MPVDFILKFIFISFFIILLVLLAYLNIKTKKKIADTDSLLNILFNNTADSIFIFDPQTMIITKCNDTALEMFRLGDKNLILGKSVNEIFKNPYSKEDWILLKNEPAKKKSFEAEFKTLDNNSFTGSVAMAEVAIGNIISGLLRITNISQKVKDRKSIADTRKIMREVVNLVPQPIYLKNQKAKLIFANKAYADLINQDLDLLTGKTDLDFENSHEGSLSYKDDLQVIQSGQEKINDAEYFTDAAGQIRIVQTTKIPFELGSSDKRGLLGIGIDITDRVKDKEAIEESRKMLMEIINLLPHPIFLRANDGKILLANEAYALMHGMRIDEIIGKTYADILIPEYADRFQQMEKEIIKDGKVKFFPEEISTDLNGNIRIMNVSKIPFYLSVEDTTGILGVGVDVTKAKISEKLLKDNERKFRALIENASDVIIILDHEFEIKYVGPSITRILGYSSSFFIGKSVYDFIHEDEKELTAQFLSDTMQWPGENQMVKELLIKNSEGKFLYFEIVVVNMLSDPAINGIIMNGHDITERKISESELMNTNFELDSFVYKASHDLKAPLRSMMGLIKLAKLESKDPNLNIYLDMMNKSVVNLDVFIKDLTQFSRNSRLEIEANLINFDEIISESIGNLKYMENAFKVTINKSIELSAKFYSDKTRISTIINNLISNAFKYYRIEKNNPYINIVIFADKKSCGITIQDNGVGIDASHLDKIFDMFYRASDSSYGSGLGLYIVKGAVAKLNGSIDVESEIDKGTKFIITIPNLLGEYEG